MHLRPVWQCLHHMPAADYKFMCEHWDLLLSRSILLDRLAAQCLHASTGCECVKMRSQSCKTQRWRARSYKT